MNVKIFIDGSCILNPGIGGAGLFAEVLDNKYFLSFSSQKITTNNRMEIGSLLFSFNFLKKLFIDNSFNDFVTDNTNDFDKLFDFCKNKKINIDIFTDSTYVKLGWDSLEKWNQRHWTSSSKTTKLLNVDLWKILLKIKNYSTKYCVVVNVKWISRDYNSTADLLSRFGSKGITVAIKEIGTSVYEE
jgi:ribonuclease HI